MNKATIVHGLFIACGLIWSNASQAQECQLLQSRIPCFVEWHHLFDVVDRDETTAKAIGASNAGEILVPGVTKDFSHTDRIILKYENDGTPIYTLDLAGVPWYLGSSSSDTWYDFPWHKVVVDDARGRVFVLLAGDGVPRDFTYEFFLAAHDLQSGQRLSGWGGANRYVGHSQSLNGGLDVDANGNVWTVLQDLPGQTVGLRVKKWNGDNGDNISPTNVTPPQDYFLVASANKRRDFTAFGIPQNDNKLYIAFSEHDSQGTKDLVVTLWDQNLQFLHRLDYTRELPAPDVVPSPSLVYHNTTDHPYFSAGLVDEQGNLLIGGTYKFLRQVWEFERDYVFPLAVKFGVTSAGISLETVFEYIETEHFKDFGTYPSQGPFSVRIADAPDGSTFLRMFYVYRINSSGQYVDHVLLHAPFGDWGPVEEPTGSGCYYFSQIRANGFEYDRNRLLVSGTVGKTWLNCGGDEDRQAFVISYRRGQVPFCCVVREFEWLEPPWWSAIPPYRGDRVPERRYAALPAFFPNYLPSAAWSPARIPPDLVALYRDIHLLSAKVPPAEFPRQLVEGLAKRLETMPPGRSFDRRLQDTVLKALADLKGSAQVGESLTHRLIEAANAIALDRLVPELASREVTAGHSTTVHFPAVASLAFKGATGSRATSLRIQSGLPAFAEGFEPAWPLATYRFEYTGKLSERGEIDISFDVGNMQFSRDVSSLHILEWDGKTYRDITVAFDLQKKRVTGRTNRLADLVIMGAVRGSHTAEIK